jgi:hypothetical protein
VATAGVAHPLRSLQRVGIPNCEPLRILTWIFAECGGITALQFKNAWDESSNALDPLGTSENSPALPAPGSVTPDWKRVPGGTPEIHNRETGIKCE